MSDYPTSWDPYAPPQAQQVPVARGLLPTGLKAVCIIAIVLGGLGTLFSCGGVASLAIGPSMQAAFNTPAQPGMDQEAARVQQELQAEIAAIGQEYLPFTITSVILHLLSGLAVVVSVASWLSSCPPRAARYSSSGASWRFSTNWCMGC